LEQFAYVASHDLQEPLRKVASCCQVLAEDYGPQLDDKAREWIGFAVDGAQRMRQLVSDLLSYSRVGTRGKAAVPTDAAAACSTAIKNLSATIEESAAVVRCDRLPWVMADDTQLVQLFQNLIGNALKYRSDASPAIDVGCQRQGDRFRFSIRDNGIGIDPRFHQRIFDIFQRLHGKEKYSGTGIGLAICKKIVGRMGGEIWVESQVGEGSTFYFTLPASAPDNARTSESPSPTDGESVAERAVHAAD
jgi:light-regulated signal transduction histidine kinase (bacteriophytochrome)